MCLLEKSSRFPSGWALHWSVFSTFLQIWERYLDTWFPSSLLWKWRLPRSNVQSFNGKRVREIILTYVTSVFEQPKTSSRPQGGFMRVSGLSLVIFSSQFCHLNDSGDSVVFLWKTLYWCLLRRDKFLLLSEYPSRLGRLFPLILMTIKVCFAGLGWLKPKIDFTKEQMDRLDRFNSLRVDILPGGRISDERSSRIQRDQLACTSLRHLWPRSDIRLSIKTWV